MVDIPLITLVIKSINSEDTTLISSGDKTLIDTLSMLCSFLSVDDLCSFVYSEKFIKLTDYGYDIVFELGVYSEHSVVLQLTAEREKLTLADTNEQNLIDNKKVECYDKDSFNSVISKWLQFALR